MPTHNINEKCSKLCGATPSIFDLSLLAFAKTDTLDQPSIAYRGKSGS